MAKTYTINKLEWTDKELIEEFDSICAHTVFGNYRIEKTRRGFLWEYSFCDYYDEDRVDCDSVEDGKSKAEAHWIERVLGCLTPVTRKRKR